MNCVVEVVLHAGKLMELCGAPRQWALPPQTRLVPNCPVRGRDPFSAHLGTPGHPSWDAPAKPQRTV